MKLKLKLIAGATLAACSAGSFAATAVTCPGTTSVVDAATAETFVTKCAPEVTLFIGGASTLKGNAKDILFADVFDTAAMVPIQIVDRGSYAGLGSVGTTAGTSTTGGNVVAYLGKSKTALGAKLTLAVYNFNNGSAAGVSQVLIGKAPKLADAIGTDATKRLPEADVVFVGPAKDATTPGGTVANAFCGATASLNASSGSGTTAAPYKVECKSHTASVADVALSDVAAGELYSVYASAAKSKLSGLTQTPLFSQSFGVAVSKDLYAALQTKNLAESAIPSTCTAGDTTAACQPTIKSAEYASLVSKAGSIKSLAALTGDTSLTSTLTLARRDDLSGTQASSNIFFVNGQCGGNGNQAVAKSVDALVKKAGGLGGGLPIISSADTTYTGLNILSAAVTQDVKNAVGGTGYAIGVLNVGSGGTISASPAVSGYAGRFVKIDGVSPNYVNGVADSRTQLANGSYPFSLVSYAMVNTAYYSKLATEKKAMIDALIGGFKDSGLHNLAGIAYFDGAVPAQQSKVVRKDGNNCSPLIVGSSL